MIELMRQRLAIDWRLLTEYWWVWLAIVALAVGLIGVIAWYQRRGNE